MQTAKVFQNGNSQAVRIPKAYRLQGGAVKISQCGRGILLEPLDLTFTSMLEAIGEFSNDFMDGGRNQPKLQNRDEVFD